MIIFLINVLIIGLYSFLYNFKFRKSQKAKKILIILSILQLITLLGFKDISIGSDMPNYWQYYQSQLEIGFDSLAYYKYELGFKILTKIITMIIENKQVYLLIIASLSLIPIGFVTYKYSKMPFLTLILYIFIGFFAFNFSGLRQSIALGFIFLSYHFMHNSKIIKYFTSIVLAAFFHISAIIFLPIYLFKKSLLSNGKIIIFGLLSLIIILFRESIFNLVNKYFYQDYHMVLTDSYAWLIMCTITVIFCLAFRKKVITNDRNDSQLYILTMVGILLMLFAPIADNIMRIANYFYIFIILLIPTVLSTIKNSKKRLIISMVIVITFFIIYIYLLNIDGYNIIPYKFWI